MPYSPSIGLLRDHFLEVRELAGAAAKVDLAVADDGDAGRIVAAVFEPPQPVDEDRDDLLRADVSDDPAHADESFTRGLWTFSGGNPAVPRCAASWFARPSLLCSSACCARSPARRRGTSLVIDEPAAT